MDLGRGKPAPPTKWLPRQGDWLGVCTIGKEDWEIVTQNNGQRKTRFLRYVIDSRNVYLA